MNTQNNNDRAAWIAGAVWALKDQGVDMNVYIREALADACPIKAA